MKARAGTGWQYVMTDLSMILFMITAAAVNDAPPDPRGPAPPAPSAPPPVPVLLAAPALGEPIAVWRGGAGSPTLGQWLTTQPSDPRQRLTIVGSAAAPGEALRLATGAGRPARILLEPGSAGAPFATLTYDQSPDMARPLQSAGANPPAR